MILIEKKNADIVLLCMNIFRRLSQLDDNKQRQISFDQRVQRSSDAVHELPGQRPFGQKLPDAAS